ncbi:uncharacterized protein LOC114315509 [Camellia sinensis]|uniref:uncharacterized protein LOC114315509 n=1 Tax=Camellia sinensis TaxID=4442 RepID=UPI0010369FDF|nr:uncharacterized protein LOC114315509 [Camellia sinensis]
MSELCLSNTPKKTSSPLLSELLFFFSFILSHPIYLSYFILFSPYLLKLLSFLSPLFITTSLLLLSLLSLSPGLLHLNNPPHHFSQSKLGFFFLLSTAYNALIQRLISSNTDNTEEHQQSHHHHPFEDLEAFKIVFDISTFYSTENADQVFEFKSDQENSFESPLLKSSIDECSGLSTLESLFADLEERTVEIDSRQISETDQSIKETERLEGVEEKKNKAELAPSTKSEKVQVSLVRSESEAIKASSDSGGQQRQTTSQRIHGSVNISDNGGEDTLKLLESQSSQTLDSSFGSYGSLRREKDWKRTLACKLFEERHNVDGVEGMDLLWETHEIDSKAKPNNKNKNKSKKKKKGGSDYYYEDDNGDDGDEGEEDVDAKLCCLQALKFSAGKMNLGMRKPNLVKISKAIKGIGLFYKHGKKGYN